MYSSSWRWEICIAAFEETANTEISGWTRNTNGITAMAPMIEPLRR